MSDVGGGDAPGGVGPVAATEALHPVSDRRDEKGDAGTSRERRRRSARRKRQPTKKDERHHPDEPSAAVEVEIEGEEVELPPEEGEHAPEDDRGQRIDLRA